MNGSPVRVRASASPDLQEFPLRAGSPSIATVRAARGRPPPPPGEGSERFLLAWKPVTGHETLERALRSEFEVTYGGLPNANRA
jgi:hypothetical protein